MVGGVVYFLLKKFKNKETDEIIVPMETIEVKTNKEEKFEEVPKTTKRSIHNS